ncbi:MAG: monovalent cation/H+ antiporter complex subunit F [Candidatus Binatia bacterium]
MSITNGVLFFAGCTVLVGIFLIIIRAIIGPTVYDRILAANAAGTKAVIFVALLGFMLGRPGFLDVALLYALINFVVTIGILKFTQYRRLG